MSESNKSITFIMEKSLYDRISKIASKDKVSRGHVIRGILEQNIAERESWAISPKQTVSK